MVKRFYELYDARKNEPRALERKQKRLARAKSEQGMRKKELSPKQTVEHKQESELKPSANVELSKKKKQKLTRRLSYNFNTSAFLSDSRRKNTDEGKELQRTPSKQFQRIKLEPRQDPAISGVPEATSPRKSWLPTWFGTSDSNLKKEKKKNLKEGVESLKSISDLTHSLEEALEHLGATYSFTAKRDRIKARISKRK